jgi:hypothetical protein
VIFVNVKALAFLVREEGLSLKVSPIATASLIRVIEIGEHEDGIFRPAHQPTTLSLSKAVREASLR